MNSLSSSTSESGFVQSDDRSENGYGVVAPYGVLRVRFSGLRRQNTLAILRLTAADYRANLDEGVSMAAIKRHEFLRIEPDQRPAEPRKPWQNYDPILWTMFFQVSPRILRMRVNVLSWQE